MSDALNLWDKILDAFAPGTYVNLHSKTEQIVGGTGVVAPMVGCRL